MLVSLFFMSLFFGLGSGNEIRIPLISFGLKKSSIFQASLPIELNSAIELSEKNNPDLIISLPFFLKILLLYIFWHP